MNTGSSLFQEITEEEIQKILEAALHYKDSFSYRLLEGGLFNTTYLIECPGKGRYVLRLGPVNRHLLLDFEHNLMNAECYVYELCHNKGIPCSQVVYCDTSKKILDRDYMLVHYIESCSLAGAQLPPEEKSRIYRQVGSYMKLFHSIKGEGFGRVSTLLKGHSFDSWYEAVTYEINAVLKKGIHFQLWDDAYQKRLTDFFLQHKGILEKVTAATLLHTDLWEGNVLIKNGSCVGIIDPDRAVFGDVEMEFVSPWMINDDFISGYGAIEHSPDWSTKQKLYQVFFYITDAYVWSCEYNQPQNTAQLLHQIDAILQG